MARSAITVGRCGFGIGGDAPSGMGTPGAEPVLQSARCELCAVLGSNVHSTPQTRHRLRVAFVDGDPDIGLAARGLTDTPGACYTVQVYEPCSSFPKPSDSKTSPGGNPEPAFGPPDIVLLSLPSREPIRLACATRLKALAPDLRLLIISDHCDASAIAQWCVAGADGVLIKPFATEDLARAIQEVAQERRFLCRKAQSAMVDYIRCLGAARRCTTLSAREREVMLRVMAGGPNKTIASELGISAGTLHWHLANIFKKMGVRSKEEARRTFQGV
jgi:DNA-binding NarL/FixJ family response regulator